jgi:hypothetical protein
MPTWTRHSTYIALPSVDLMLKELVRYLTKILLSTHTHLKKYILTLQSYKSIIWRNAVLQKYNWTKCIRTNCKSDEVWMDYVCTVVVHMYVYVHVCKIEQISAEDAFQQSAVGKQIQMYPCAYIWIHACVKLVVCLGRHFVSVKLGPMLWFFKYFRRIFRRKNWRFWLKTKLHYAKIWS